MHETTFGCTFAMFDAMGQYLIMTNGGTADENATDQGAGHRLDLPDLDATRKGEPESIAMSRNPMIDPNMTITHVDNLPKDTRELIREMDEKHGV